MCFDTGKNEVLKGRSQCSFEGQGCVCVDKATLEAHASGEDVQNKDKKCYNNPQLRSVEDWHTKEREMCEMDQRVWCESNEQCQGSQTCYEEYTNFFMERDSFCNNYQGGCFCKDKPKNNFCEFSADVMRVMQQLDNAYVNMDFDTQTAANACPCKEGTFCNHDFNDTDTGGFCEGCGKDFKTKGDCDRAGFINKKGAEECKTVCLPPLTYIGCYKDKSDDRAMPNNYDALDFDQCR